MIYDIDSCSIEKEVYFDSIVRALMVANKIQQWYSLFRTGKTFIDSDFFLIGTHCYSSHNCFHRKQNFIARAIKFKIATRTPWGHNACTGSQSTSIIVKLIKKQWDLDIGNWLFIVLSSFCCGWLRLSVVFHRQYKLYNEDWFHRNIRNKVIIRYNIGANRY